nr:MAG: wsv332-like protein [Metapenaeus ensis nimavirus]
MEFMSMDGEAPMDVSGEAGFPNVIDQAGMCVVNFTSICRRVSSMSENEMECVSEISERFLSCLIRLAHCNDANLIRETAQNMAQILLNDIHDSSSLKDKFPSFTSLADMEQERQRQQDREGRGAGSISKDVLVTSLMGCLDPVTILSGLLGNDTGGGNAMTKGIDSILSMLKGYNPIKLDDLIVLERCQRGKGCVACLALQGELRNQDRADPCSGLLYLLRCLYHRRLLFGGDSQSAQASPALRSNENNPNVIVVPLRSMLLNYVDSLGGPHSTEKLTRLHETSKMNEIDTYSDRNKNWKHLVCERVRNIKSLKARGTLAQIYVFLVCSRYRPQTGDFIKQFLYTVFSRFLYSATEILFCDQENTSKEVDDGKFLKYFDALTNISVMGSSFQTMKAYLAWREGAASAAPILDIFSPSWRRDHGEAASLEKFGVDMSKYINDLAKPTRLGASSYKKDNRKQQQSNHRTRRAAECYMPFGLLDENGSFPRLSTSKLSFHAKKYSNGNNIPHNCFHILSNVEGASALGQTGRNDQAAFEETLSPDGVRRGSGKALGLITSIIDKSALNCEPPKNLEDHQQRVGDFMRDVVFKKQLVHEDSANAYSLLPDSRTIFNKQAIETSPRCFDARVYTLFLLWQRPCIPYPNVSALTASQLELMLSKEPKWAKFITNLFFNIERTSFQLADAIVKSPGEGRGFAETLFGRNNTGPFNSGQVDATTKIQDFIEKAIGIVSKEWTSGSFDAPPPSRKSVSSAKAQYSSKLFELLHDVIIVHDMNPTNLIANSDFLRNYIRFMDEMLMNLQQGMRIV